MTCRNVWVEITPRWPGVNLHMRKVLDAPSSHRILPTFICFTDRDDTNYVGKIDGCLALGNVTNVGNNIAADVHRRRKTLLLRRIVSLNTNYPG